MKNLKELEQKYLELGKEIEALKKQSEIEEFTYPIYFKNKYTSLVVKFTGLQSGEVVINEDEWNVGESSMTWIKHTNKDEWQKLDVCKKTGFFDGQLVWCWDNDDTHIRELRFYDVKYKCTYMFGGDKNGGEYDNYAPFEGNYPDWALEAFQTLER
jgi:hypothetical protein